MRHPDLTALPLVDGGLYELTGQRGPGYPAIYKAVLNGDLPAVRQGSRIFVRKADMPVIAAHFGLTIPADRAA